MTTLLAQADVATPFLQYGALGLVAFIVVSAVAGMRWLLPKIVSAVENIAPTVATATEKAIASLVEQLKAQEERHAEERRAAAEERARLIAQHAEERGTMFDTIQDAAKATRDALAEHRNGR